MVSLSWKTNNDNLREICERQVLHKVERDKAEIPSTCAYLQNVEKKTGKERRRCNCSHSILFPMLTSISISSSASAVTSSFLGGIQIPDPPSPCHQAILQLPPPLVSVNGEKNCSAIKQRTMKPLMISFSVQMPFLCRGLI